MEFVWVSKEEVERLRIARKPTHLSTARVMGVPVEHSSLGVSQVFLALRGNKRM